MCLGEKQYQIKSYWNIKFVLVNYLLSALRNEYSDYHLEIFNHSVTVAVGTRRCGRNLHFEEKKLSKCKALYTRGSQTGFHNFRVVPPCACACYQLFRSLKLVYNLICQMVPQVLRQDVPCLAGQLWFRSWKLHFPITPIRRFILGARDAAQGSAGINCPHAPTNSYFSGLCFN